MPLLISVLSQKGGVGKSSLARLIAREYAANDWSVRIADMDTSQTTSLLWNARRVHYGHAPHLRVESYGAVQAALNTAGEVDLLVFDGAPASTAMSAQIAQAAHLIVLPSGLSLDDLIPQTKLGQEFLLSGIPESKMIFVLNGVGQSESETQEARNVIVGRGFRITQAALSQLTCYRRANDRGLAFSETPYASARKSAEDVARELAEQAATAMEIQPNDQKQRIQKAR